ncbi:zincin-like metallopeptidase domain-containing protein [Pedobacter gandavensis]|uniref:ArdC family protein n=1 Tax=Pedobacter gandavensis TaxID=2679963 RepID=UPI0024799D27|nr:zincin-like metallopeptidase domain-containing protein [Pedobacter gandavensis]WGQ08994.1 zincin-like metallopeptidase domain-containing protein [Pedobacter gandavensis]
MANEKAKPLYVQVAEKLIEQLKEGTAPWQKPWDSSNLPAFELPYNAVTGNRYKGINTMSLLIAAYQDPRWMTFNQAASQDWRVKKGEKGSLIQFVKLTDLSTKRDEQGKQVLDELGKPLKVQVKLSKPIITNAWVFNAAQVDGLEPLKRPEIASLGWDPLERAEQLITNSGASIEHKSGDRAFYSPLRDEITMPLREQFNAPDKYYATLLHELGHWTGHSSRLDRSIMNKFGTEDYAREELRAEIASLLIGQELRIGHDPGQHTAYVESWIKMLSDTPFEIHAAAADAEKILGYLIGLERKRELKAERTIDNPLTETYVNLKSLSIGDEIAYKDTVYKVLGHVKQGRLRMEDLGTGNNFLLSKTDGLYSSLLSAKQGALRAPSSQISVNQEQNQPESEVAVAYGIKR